MKPLPLLLILIICVTAASRLSAADGERPNILYFYVDDMGWGAIGPNAQAERRAKGLPNVRTPNLDRLARQGVNFSRGYGCHVCSPARSSQQSGFHQGHTFSDRNDPNNAKKAMRADEILIGDALSAAGYTTGYWGKWGYGGSKDQANPVIENVQTLPTSHGYQHVLAELHHVRAHTFFQPTLWSAPAPANSKGGLHLVANSMGAYLDAEKYPNTPALQGHANYPKTAYCDDSYAFAALDFVRAQGQSYNQSGKPFFGLLAVQIPHAPFDEISTLPDWNEAYADDAQFAGLANQTKQWAAMVTRIDAHFGNILAALEDPNHDGDKSDSIADNTLVIFQSDNGGPGGKNNIELDANGGLRGNKGQIYEGGIRVPLLMRWPSRINDDSKLKAGTTSNMVVDVTDLLPTFCDLADCPTPLGIDGVSIAPTLTGEGHQRKREFIIHEAGNGQSIIHGNHKLVRIQKGKGKAAPYVLELYDLDSDHSETNDIAAKHPGLVKELEGILLAERVDEPKGFANTYHHWTGNDGGSAADADHWSDYVYANAGVTYITESGAPQVSWTADITNSTGNPNTARTDSDLEFLGLEIRGNQEQGATQTLALADGVTLTGRNEIRISAQGTLQVNGGTVTSLRWINIHGGGNLKGNGIVEGTIYNGGSIVTEIDGFKVSEDFHQSPDAKLDVALGHDKQTPIEVAGEAILGGTLCVRTGGDLKAVTGSTYQVMQANRIVASFDNPGDEVVADDGTRFSIRYTESDVLLIAK